MALAAAAELYDWTREVDVVDGGFSRTVILTAHGRVTARNVALAQAAAGLIASLDDDHRASPRDLLEAVRMPLEEPL